MQEIIYLEPDEEITSVIDKLKALNPETKAVSLVIPKGAAILQSVVNLKLLQKEGKSLGKDLSVVTQDRIGRNLASQAGFTVYDNVNAPKPVIEPPRPQPKTEEIIELDLTAQKDQEKAPGVPVHRYDEGQVTPPSEPLQPEPQKPAIAKPLSAEDFSAPKISKPSGPGLSRKKKIILAIGGILLIALGVLFYLFYPKAIITLAVQTESFEQPLEIIIDNNIVQNDEDRKAIPGELLEAEQQGGKKFKATGKKEIGEKAKGTITVSNDSGDAQTLAAGSEFQSNNLTFKAISNTTVPGATASVDSKGNVVKTPGKVDVSVEAAEAGDQYNISPSSFTVVGKSMLSGQSSAAMSGGVSKQLTIVSQNDLNNAKSELANEITSALHEQLNNKAGKNKIIESTIKDENISSEANKKAGEEAEEFEMKVKVKSSTLSFSEKDYRQMIVKALAGAVPEGKELVLSADDEISTGTVDSDIDHGLLTLQGTVKTRLAPKIDQEELKKSIKGKNRVEAEEIIKQNDQIESVDVFLRPSWWLKKVPALDQNIEIKFEYK